MFGTVRRLAVNKTSLMRRPMSSSSHDWFTLENLRSKAAEVSVSRSKNLLPCLPSTTLTHREKMFKERELMITQSEDEKTAERAKRRAAVLVPFCFKEGKPAVLFTVRSQLVSTHKGHVSFPGGHCDEGEAAPRTAVRETIEELGESIGQIHLIARCTAIPAVTGTAVQPIIGLLEKDVGSEPHVHFQLSELEVDRCFALTIDDLYNPNLRVDRLSHPKTGLTQYIHCDGKLIDYSHSSMSTLVPDTPYN
jgi:8-oxo-dGTP pyrophosphatase MutT (NUDIX family)